MQLNMLGKWICALSVAVTFSVCGSTWTGGGAAGDWNDSSNWDGGVPVADSLADFTGDVVISSAFSLPGKVTIRVAANKRVDFNGVISGTGPLVVGEKGSASNYGSVYFNATNAFTGNLEVLHGFVYGTVDNAFGAADAGRIMVNPDQTAVSRTQLYYKGIRSLRTLEFTLVDQKTVTFDGVTTVGTIVKKGNFRGTINGKLFVTGASNLDSLLLFSFAEGAELVFTNNPSVLLPYVYTHKGKVILASVSNTVNRCTSGPYAPLGYPWSRIAFTLRCDVNGAITESSALCFEATDNTFYPGYSKLDLNGTTQSVRRLTTYTDPSWDKWNDVTRLGRVTSSVGGLITVNDGVDFINRNVFEGTASLEMKLASGITGTLLAKSTSSGELIATSGTTVLTNGAQWVGTVRVGNGAVLKTCSADAFSNGVARIFLEGGTLELAEGSYSVKELRDATGTSLAFGWYAATASGEIKACEGLSGAGVIFVAPPDDPPEQAWTWCGGGVDDKVTTLGNWKNATELPDFGYTGNVFSFPSNATVELDVPVNAKSLVFDEDASGTVEFTSTPEANGRLMLANGVIDIRPGTSDRVKKIVFKSPFKFGGDLAASVPKGSSLSFESSFDSAGGASFEKTGYGELRITGNANKIYGDVTVRTGHTYLTGLDPLGGTGALYIYPEAEKHKETALYLSNAVVNRPVSRINPDGHNQLYALASTTNVLAGLVSLQNGFFTFTVQSKARLDFAGDFMLITQRLLYPSLVDDASEVRFTSPHLNDNDAVLYGASSELNNYARFVLGASGSKFATDYNFKICCTHVYSAPNVFSNAVPIQIVSPKARVDLGGWRQAVANCCCEGVLTDGVLTACGGDVSAANGGTIFGASGSKLVLTDAIPCQGTSNADTGIMPVFGGAASVERAGAGTNTFRRANISTGEVSVVAGRLVFAAAGDQWDFWQKVNNVWTRYPQTSATAGTWAGKKATVSGGELVIGHSYAFPKDAEFYLEGGTLELASGVVQQIGSLWLKKNGDWVKCKDGFYGSATNLSVPPENRLALITGDGTLLAGRVGLAIILK
ncbi:MAG TPA: hypothetical protein PK576_02240 [Kiritimatiellia bacterium]|nr:hypothetical protein [Kiritimatiellia bacterium]